MTDLDEEGVPPPSIVKGTTLCRGRDDEAVDEVRERIDLDGDMETGTTGLCDGLVDVETGQVGDEDETAEVEVAAVETERDVEDEELEDADDERVRGGEPVEVVEWEGASATGRVRPAPLPTEPVMLMASGI